MKTVVVVAPHPDDEILGCGGTLLRHVDEGDVVHWVIVTQVTERMQVSHQWLRRREQEIEEVASRMGFSGIHRLRFPAAELDRLGMAVLVPAIKAIFDETRPETVYLPSPYDVHTDHRVCFDAAASAVKWFRAPSVRDVFVYETPSETDFGIRPDAFPFRPSCIVDISQTLERKIDAMQVYRSEFGEHPFPRSEEGMRALARVRGAAGGFEYAEAFQLVRSRR